MCSLFNFYTVFVYYSQLKIDDRLIPSDSAPDDVSLESLTDDFIEMVISVAPDGTREVTLKPSSDAPLRVNGQIVGTAPSYAQAEVLHQLYQPPDPLAHITDPDVKKVYLQAAWKFFAHIPNVTASTALGALVSDTTTMSLDTIRCMANSSITLDNLVFPVAAPSRPLPPLEETLFAYIYKYFHSCAYPESHPPTAAPPTGPTTPSSSSAPPASGSATRTSGPVQISRFDRSRFVPPLGPLAKMHIPPLPPRKVYKPLTNTGRPKHKPIRSKARVCRLL